MLVLAVVVVSGAVDRGARPPRQLVPCVARALIVLAEARFWTQAPPTERRATSASTVEAKTFISNAARDEPALFLLGLSGAEARHSFFRLILIFQKAAPQACEPNPHFDARNVKSADPRRSPVCARASY